jgi:hypothetical protein
VKIWIVAKIQDRTKHRFPYFHGWTEENNNVRLAPKENSFEQLPFQVGEIWDLSLITPPLFAPHIENRIVASGEFISREPDLRSFLIEKVKPWKGSLDQLFDGKLAHDVRKGSYEAQQGMYIEQTPKIPLKSIGYWLPDEPLISTANSQGFLAYHSQYKSYRVDIDYTGSAPPISVIPAQTLVNVSLKLWWWRPSVQYYHPGDYRLLPPKDKELSDRCYLEVCSWYL